MSRRSQFEERRLPLLEALHEADLGRTRPATVRSLATAIGAGFGTTHDYLLRLRSEGLLDWQEKRVRTLRLTDLGRAAIAAESNGETVPAAQAPQATPAPAPVKATPLVVDRELDEFAVGF